MHFSGKGIGNPLTYGRPSVVGPAEAIQIQRRGDTNKRDKVKMAKK